MVKNVTNTVLAIFTAGALLYGMRQVPVVKNLAEIITKGYGE